MAAVRFLAAVALLLVLSPTGGAASIDATIDTMSDAERIAQLLIVGVSGPVDSAELRRNVREWGIGGVVLYARNLESPEQVRRLTSAINGHAGRIAPFVAIDQEGGIVKRLRLGVPVLPSAMALGATRSPDLARRAGAAVGTALRALGFTMNFAPVLDVLSAVNDSLGTRSFGGDATLVADLGAAFIEGQQAAGVVSVGKHFPGIGGVAGDTHKRLPRLDASLEVLRTRDLLPFRQAADRGLMAIMTGHVALPRIAERNDLPATLSRRVMTTLLRKELHFEGILITDALQMDALARDRGASVLALEALLAGSDMILTVGGSKERDEVFAGLRAAYRDGRLPKARVRQALRRILAVKATLRRPIVPQKADGIVDEIAARAITQVGIPELPAVATVGARLRYIGVDGPLRSRLPGTVQSLPAHIDASEATQFAGMIAATMKGAPLCIAAAATQDQFDVIRRAHENAPETPLIFVNLGSPHRILSGPRVITLLTYADDAASQLAAARVILGEAEARGVPPVALPP